MRKHKILTAILILLGVCIIGAFFTEENTPQIAPQQNIETLVYEDEKFVVKILKYEKEKIFEGVSLYFYVENKTDSDIKFAVDGSVVLNGDTVESLGTLQEVKANSKALPKMSIYKADTSVDFTNLQSLVFDFDIYESENFIETVSHVKDQSFTYNF